MRVVLSALLFTALLGATDADALRRHRVDSKFFQRTAVGFDIGSGMPLGQFEGDGAHKNGGTQWAIDAEYFFAPNVSIGGSFQRGTFDDKDLGATLQTELNSLSGFVRYTFVTDTNVHPFLRFGIGAMEVTFDGPDGTDAADYEGMIHFDGGVFVMLGDNLSLDGMVSYGYGFTEEAFVAETADEIFLVGFDVEYVTFGVGITAYLP